MKKIVFLASAFLCTACVRASTPDSTITFRQLTDSIQSIMRQDNIVGLMLGITTKDSIVFTGGFGYADKAAQRRVDGHTLFRMGSITKMLVSLGIMQLIQEGKLSLNTPLKSIAPEVPFYNPWEATNPILVIHLLEHTSGFDDIKLNSMYAADNHINKGIDMMLVHKNSMICRWRPGERMAYCNPNYAILGYIIEKIKGIPYHQYLTNQFLTPLGMRNSNFNLNSQLSQDTKEYAFEKGQLKQVKSVTLLSGAAGALWSNPEDMVKLLQFFLRSGAPLFESSIIDEIERPHSSLAARAGIMSGYALGNQDVFLNTKYPFRGHSGLVGTCFSSCFYNREKNIGYVLASNSNANNGRIEALLINYLQQAAPETQLTAQPTDVQAITPYLGMYQFESPRNAISGFVDRLQYAPRIYLVNGKLFIKSLTGKVVQLSQTAPLTFAWQGDKKPRIVFTTNDKGQRVMLQGGIYFEQVSYSSAITKRVLLVFAVLVAMIGALASLIALIKRLAGKLTTLQLLPRLLPVIGLGSLTWAVVNLLEVQKYTYKLSEMGSINARTLSICLGTAIYGIASITTLLWALQKIIKQKKGWGWLLSGLGFFTITLLLWQNGWIGLRPWAM